MKYPKLHFWFTLVEVIISITILSIIMVSVMVIFSSSSALSLKVDINRSVQENVKNAVEDMAESVRKDKIVICSSTILDDCYNFSTATGKYIYSDTLYTGAHYYYLAKLSTTGDWVKVTNMPDCEAPSATCTLVKDGQYPLTNKNIVFRNLKFSLSNDIVPKVTIHFSMYPAAKRGVSYTTIQNDSFDFQTTISQSLIVEK